jgi:Phage major tail protein 2.
MAFPSAAIPGRKAYLRSSSNSSQSSSQVVMAELLDFTFTVEEDNIDVTNHDSSGWAESIIGIRRWSWDATANYLSTGAGQGALRQSLVDADASLYITFQATTSITAKKYQGRTRLTAFGQQNNSVNGQVQASFRGQGTGPIVRTA